MPPAQSAAKAEREKKLKAVLGFASVLAKRFEELCDQQLVNDLERHILSLPLQASTAVTAKREELDRLGTELWNLSTRLRRERPRASDASCKTRAISLLRVFSFFLLDSATSKMTNATERRSCCIRLMKVALKAAKVCIENQEMLSATKVLERAAEYEDLLGQEAGREKDGDVLIGDRLRVEYFGVRMVLAWRQDRMDTAEHMFAKCKQLKPVFTPANAENISDLLYEVGRGLLEKRNYELSARWMERAHDILEEQELEMLSPEAGELRLSIMQSIANCYMKLEGEDSRDKAWKMVRLLEADYQDKMAVSLLKLELLSKEPALNSQEFYAVLSRMIRIVVLNDRNFKTIMHHIHKIVERDSLTACKLIDDLIHMRLFREENDVWIEKSVITRIWICCTKMKSEITLEELRTFLDSIMQNVKGPFTAQATHATQTLLWKQAEVTFSQEQYQLAENWCRICLHPLFEKAGDVNKSKIARKIILCAQARHDHGAARQMFSEMPNTGRNDRITRYIMYKTGLQTGDSEFITECLDHVFQHSGADATLLYACILEAQACGSNTHAISALERVLDKYDHNTPPDVHVPALLRMTLRLLGQELTKDGNLNHDVLTRICKVCEGACKRAKESRQRPTASPQDQFNLSEFEWFSKNTYNWSIKYCAEMQPTSLVRLLNVCIEFIKLLRHHGHSEGDIDLSLRLMFCEFLVTCTYTTLARAEDNVQECLQYYSQARRHGKACREIAATNINQLGESAQADAIAKHFQVVKLELEAVLKLERWDEMDDLFDQCWKYKYQGQYETLADLVLIIHSIIVKSNLDRKYQSKVLSVLQRVINTTTKQNGDDAGKLARWIRCLFQLSLTFDENVSLRCVEQAITLASTRKDSLRKHGSKQNTPSPPSSAFSLTMADLESLFADETHPQGPNAYPAIELEWLATTTFNHAVDYYIQENDAKCKEWAEKALALAAWAEGSNLRDVLMEKYSELTWGEGGQ
ncbi:SPO22-domain-containing protein [Periconia macrospinosa]|uniref:SPO22-domain-containing protein n=1 Tax=Periconia macrospinosa TaxID=97972 RepID=A0A2V1D9Y6_9PLEO|nr:SPO22-domain-containing protein [Periconia macrospinosa]